MNNTEKYGIPPGESGRGKRVRPEHMASDRFYLSAPDSPDGLEIQKLLSAAGITISLARGERKFHNTPVLENNP